MFKRLPQPPIDPAARRREQHDFLPGFIAALAGGILLFYGAQRITGVNAVDGNAVLETQLVKAFSFGGVQYANQVAPPPPPNLEDPNVASEEMDRWAKQAAEFQAPDWKIRVDLSAKTPCPT